ncbi:hypothetical protein [Fastidiosipila sanguinis]|uniref:Uncharacterized protein n=1 Tax=Fastidiosipila sanguinis TaxID=236753 RepID=A0A2S0KPB4_9FIRM|nr:hypothetical protein [Fastidiosipila sanguinis]AVM42848.1 hypothetical protein C5Q98_06320 [Fastidiosipila sanguinis]
MKEIYLKLSDSDLSKIIDLLEKATTQIQEQIYQIEDSYLIIDQEIRNLKQLIKNADYEEVSRDE